jgi:hypothetical protein
MLTEREAGMPIMPPIWHRNIQDALDAQAVLGEEALGNFQEEELEDPEEDDGVDDLVVGMMDYDDGDQRGNPENEENPERHRMRPAEVYANDEDQGGNPEEEENMRRRGRGRRITFREETQTPVGRVGRF